uniref:G_PROTEIN_RECEP_F1_2 domain-containing protein n=2 Tax=Caenorhabditis tropicalis TaxID=1561998 RepID=A0A1I7UKX7_9PELO
MKRDAQLGYIKENFPKLLPQFSSLSNFAIYEFNAWTLLLALIAFSGTLICATVFLFTTLDMFRFLAHLKRQISTTNYKRHRAALKSLVAQFATSSLCLTPPFLYAVVIMSSLDHAQVIVQCLLAIFSLHSSVNALVLVATTPPYRNTIFRKRPQNLIIVPVSISQGL